MLMLQQSLLLLLLIHSQEPHELELSSQDSMLAMSCYLRLGKSIKLLKAYVLSVLGQTTTVSLADTQA